MNDKCNFFKDMQCDSQKWINYFPWYGICIKSTYIPVSNYLEYGLLKWDSAYWECH